MSDDLDAIGGRKSIEILPEGISIGRELLPGDAVSQIGEKTGMNDNHVKDMFPAIRNYPNCRIHFENIKDEQGRTIGFFIIGTEYGEEVFRYKVLYMGGKYVKADD
jgi:hypothetical protein